MSQNHKLRHGEKLISAGHPQESAPALSLPCVWQCHALSRATECVCVCFELAQDATTVLEFSIYIFCCALRCITTAC